MKRKLWDIRTGLKNARQMRGLSQGGLADLTGLQSSAISHFENGRRVPSVGNLVKLADALCVTLDELIERDAAKE